MRPLGVRFRLHPRPTVHALTASNSLLKLRPQPTLLAVVLLVGGCAPPHPENRSFLDGYPAPVSDPPAGRNPTPAEAADFGFRFESGCGEIINAFRNTYQTDGMAAPVPMRLTSHERAAILEVVSAIRFFDLPPTMNQPNPPDLARPTRLTFVNREFELAVHNGVAYHAVRWREPPNGADSDERSRLMKLLQKILDVVHARPEVALVRPQGCGC